MNSEHDYIGFQVSGHAGYDKIGKDIICASVSVLTINTINAIEQFTKNKFKCGQGKSGLIQFKFLSVSEQNEEQKQIGQILLRTLDLGITGISREYGDEYVQVHYKEV